MESPFCVMRFHEMGLPPVSPYGSYNSGAQGAHRGVARQGCRLPAGFGQAGRVRAVGVPAVEDDVGTVSRDAPEITDTGCLTTDQIHNLAIRWLGLLVHTSISEGVSPQ